MTGAPEKDEAVPYYFTYIDRIQTDDIVAFLKNQLDGALALFADISEERSLFRYAPRKWSIRQVLNHVTDTERTFVYRAMWFARGFTDPLPSLEQDVAAAGAEADGCPWSGHVDEFRAVREATHAFFRDMPAAGWARAGVASGNRFTVRAIAYIVAGHYAHHASVLRERYLSAKT